MIGVYEANHIWKIEKIESCAFIKMKSNVVQLPTRVEL